MDLRHLDAQPTQDERDAIDACLGPPASGWDGGERLASRDGHVAYGGRKARERRHMLLPALHAAQSRAGWVSHGALGYICERLSVPPAEAWGVVTFYALLATEPRPARVLHVCDDIVCRYKGALDVPTGEAVLHSPCLGLCDHAPAGLLTIAGPEPVEQLVAYLDTPDPESRPQRSLRLLERVGTVDPGDLDAYRASGGYGALRRAFELGPAGVIREVTDANLVGRGGAAFPTGRKWDAVAREPARPHHLVCNADESEPGTFKDRVILEGDPFAIVEAMTIAAYATGCERGYVYVRGEYPLAIRRLQDAIAQARARGLLGESVMSQPFRFDVEVRKGAGAYICGEETAIFNSIEGYRGEPRNKPPYPVQAGLFGKPTVVNNVETLVNIPSIVLDGGSAFAATGTLQSTGTKLFCLSGSVSRPGVYEVVFGTTARELIEMAGGAEDIRAVLLGGAAGVFVRPDEIDMPLTFEDTRAQGATIGSGAVMVFDDTVDLTDVLRRIAAFFRDESCGQCVPCRVGTVRQEEALHRGDLPLLDEIGAAMRDASICGLGHTAYSAIESAIKRCGVLRP